MIHGLKGTSLIDYPGKVAAVLYTKGCNFRCPFCHNQALVTGNGLEPIARTKVLETLASRCGFSEGVVITGGEPTIHTELGNLLEDIKRLGFAVKLDTNGYQPEVLRKIIGDKLVDFVAMDIKTSWAKYELATGVDIDRDRLRESVELIKESGLEYEFRTTCVPSLVNGSDIAEISRLVGKSGWYTLQQFQPVDTLNPDYKKITPYSKETLEGFLKIALENVSLCRLIGI